MTVRRSTGFLVFLLGCVLVMGGLFVVHPLIGGEEYARGLERRRQLVRDLGLTDLCLFTEARYTRHLSQADLHSAFQDHPMALEHFPSGSLVLPPPHLLEGGP
ncbi:MAG: hypothetical protein JSV00_01590 [bacterium]|nr:MAG: hypothetical protein JSV00_01590 [bacterium]